MDPHQPVSMEEEKEKKEKDLLPRREASEDCRATLHSGKNTSIKLPGAQQAIAVGREGIVCLSLSYLIQKLLELLVADLGLVVSTSK